MSLSTIRNLINVYLQSNSKKFLNNLKCHVANDIAKPKVSAYCTAYGSCVAIPFARQFHHTEDFYHNANYCTAELDTQNKSKFPNIIPSNTGHIAGQTYIRVHSNTTFSTALIKMNKTKVN